MSTTWTSQRLKCTRFLHSLLFSNSRDRLRIVRVLTTVVALVAVRVVTVVERRVRARVRVRLSLFSVSR